MKKFYSTMVAIIAAATMTASAVTPVKSQATLDNLRTNRFEIAKEAKGIESKTIKLAGKNKAVAKAAPASVAEIEGEYNWQLAPMINGDNQDVYEVEFVADATAENGIIIAGLFDAELKATYDATTGTITIPYQIIGHSSTFNEDIVFSNVTCTVNEQGQLTEVGDPDYGDVTLFYVESQDCFMTDQCYCLVGENETGFTNSDGWYSLAYLGIITHALPWKDLGKAKANLDFFFPAVFGKYPGEIEVAIQQSPYDGEENVYRLVGPWDKAFNRELGTYLVFDMSDPDCVLIPQQATGITENTMGTSFVENWYGDILSAGLTKEDFLNGNPTYELEPATPEEITTYDAATRTVNIPFESAFTLFANSQYIYRVSAPVTDEKTGEVIYTPVPGYIILPEMAEGGVDNITVSDENAPVEYYNLQGIRVNNPVKGGLYIQRQGNKAIKVIK